MAWITAHGGKPEAMVTTPPRRGLHGARFDDRGSPEDRAPRRFVLPPGALN